MAKDTQANFLRTGELLFGKYRIEKIVGRGGYGRVYKARDTLMDRDVAVKELLMRYADHPLITRRFIQEARAAGRLQHANIVTVFNLERSLDDGRFFLIMEFINGASLRQIFRKRKKLPAKHIQLVAQAVLSGLQHAHQHSVVHRDIKPDNVMVTADERIKIADFGVAKLPVHEGGFTQLSGGGMPAGTAAYLSPEQVRGEEVGLGSDLYSLGVTLYELSTGEFYFDIDSCKSFYEVQDKIIKSVPRAPSEVVSGSPKWLDDLVLGLLMKDATKRIQSAAAALLMIPDATSGVATGDVATKRSGETFGSGGQNRSPENVPREEPRDEVLASDEPHESAFAAGPNTDALQRINLYRRSNAQPQNENGHNESAAASMPLRWTFSVQESIAQVQVVGKTLFVSTVSGSVHIVNLENGEEVWRIVQRKKTRGVPEFAVTSKYLALLQPSGELVLYDWKDRRELWSVTSAGDRPGMIDGPWGPRANQRPQHVFWYGHLLYLCTVQRTASNGPIVMLDGVDTENGSVIRIVDTGFRELRSLVAAPSNASELVEGHLWVESPGEVISVDLLSSKVLRKKSPPTQVELLKLYAHFPRTAWGASHVDNFQSKTAVLSRSGNANAMAERAEEGCYSGFSGEPVLVSLEALAGTERIVSSLDLETLEPNWSTRVTGPVDSVSRTGAMNEVLFSNLSVYVTYGPKRESLLQLDINSGEPQERLDFGKEIIWLCPGSSGYLTLFDDGTIAEFQYDRNELIWSYQFESQIRVGLCVSSSEAVIVTTEKEVFALG